MKLKTHSEPTAGQQDGVPNLKRALHILGIVAHRPAGMTMSETAAALQISRNSAFRMLKTLLSHQ